MNFFPDTSFLCALYRSQDNSLAAQKIYALLTEPLTVSSLLLYEFRQSTRLQIWLHTQSPRKGIPSKEGLQALADLESNLASGAIITAAVEWADVHRLAERLSSAHTIQAGHRAMDILHIATALHLGAKEFLTFDGNQRQLALAEGLAVKPATLS